MFMHGACIDSKHVDVVRVLKLLNGLMCYTRIVSEFVLDAAHGIASTQVPDASQCVIGISVGPDVLTMT